MEIEELMDRLKRLEFLVLCSRCQGRGVMHHADTGRVACAACNGTGLNGDVRNDL